MTEHVTLDAGKPTCIGVHYMDTLHNASEHFREAGFHGITGIQYLETNLNCNEARRRALDAAKRGEGKCYYEGNWDYSAGRCALYEFDFTSYDGPTFTGPKTPDTEAHVDWKEG